MGETTFLITCLCGKEFVMWQDYADCLADHGRGSQTVSVQETEMGQALIEALKEAVEFERKKKKLKSSKKTHKKKKSK